MQLLGLIADAGPPPAPSGIWTAWSLQPVTLIALVVAACLYVYGLDRLWRRAGFGAGVRVWQAQCFMAGLFTVTIALISPLDGLSLALFSAHMVQHLLLILIAAPLFVLGVPALPFLFALPRSWRRPLVHWYALPPARRARRLAGRLDVAWTIAVAALWLWHIPALYEAALRNQVIHASEHIALLLSSVLFWQALLSRVRRGRSPAATIVASVAMGMQGMVLGIALVFSRSPWYASYAHSAPGWNISPLSDQQLAGLIMWIPAGVVYLTATLAVLGRMMLDVDGSTTSARLSAAGEQQRPLLAIRSEPVEEGAVHVVRPSTSSG
jgi:putative membrane protein